MLFFWMVAIIGCLAGALEVIWSLIPAALIQSDSDRRIKMQIHVCALFAILSLLFSLCGMLRGEELERWPWGWIFKWPPDFPAEQREPGFHLHRSVFLIYCPSTLTNSTSTIPWTIYKTFNSHCDTVLWWTTYFTSKKAYSPNLRQLNKGIEQSLLK